MQDATLGLDRGPRSGEGQVADKGCQSSGTVGLLGVSDGHTESEDEGQVVEDRATGAGEYVSDWLHPGCVLGHAVRAQHVGRSESHEQGRDRQGCDGQHEGASDALHLGEPGYLPFLLRAGGNSVLRHGVPPQ